MAGRGDTVFLTARMASAGRPKRDPVAACAAVKEAGISGEFKSPGFKLPPDQPSARKISVRNSLSGVAVGSST